MKGFYLELKLAEKFGKDEEYLREAFKFTEKLWFQQFDSIRDIKIIMLSEAPLFGRKKTYFYNPESEFTSFFYFDDLRAFYSRQDLRNDLQTIMERKKYVINSLNEKGFILAIFRGALFFPSLFQVDFGSIYRKLRKGGVAFVGGGFGKYTPPEIISRIGKRSEEVNAELGKVRVTVESIRDQLRASSLGAVAEITTDGGLWVVMKK